MPKMHKLENFEHFGRMRERWLDSNARGLELLQVGKGDVQFILGSLCRQSLDLGCIALILDRGDDEARSYFRQAPVYAIEWLRAPGSTSSPRVYDVNLEVSERGTQVTALHERKPSREPAKHSLISYTEILFAVLTFGSEVQMREVAEFPEEGYRNPNVLGSYEDLRVWKEWMLGRMEEARRTAQRVLQGSPEPSVRASLTALLAILDGKRDLVDSQLEEHVKVHRKYYQRHGNDPRGFVSMGGLALSRLAMERGMLVEDQPYLPVRLLPNYKPLTH